VDDDEAAAPREKIVQVPAIGFVDVAGFLLVENQDVRLVELGLGGKRIPAARFRAAFVQERHPFPQEARIIMRAGTVRLRAGADEHAHRIGGGGRDAGECSDYDRGEEEKLSHGSVWDYSEASDPGQTGSAGFLLSMVKGTATFCTSMKSLHHEKRGTATFSTCITRKR
jgi:hypothetical protein